MQNRRNNQGHVAGATSARSHSSALIIGAAALMAAAGMTVTATDAQAQQRTGAQQADAHGESGYHEVARGDTLWDLSGRYFGDPYEWPRMWSYNTQITNPHWIYPGDIVYLTEPEMPAAEDEPDVEPAAHEEAIDDDTDRTPLGHDDSVGLYLPLGGMLVAEEETPLGRIIGSPKAARMLVEHDEAWVGFGDDAYREDEEDELGDDEMLEVDDPDEVEEGDRFAIIRKDGALEDDDGERRAHKYYVVGSLEITEVPQQEETAKTAMIEESWREIERGDLLVPYERQLQLIQPREAEDDLVAEIVDSLDPGFAFAPQEYLFIDRGAEDGVRPGNRFFAYQQWEGYEHPHDESSPEIPWQQVGQVLVVDVREEFSTVVITRSERELYIGDRLEMYRGH